MPCGGLRRLRIKAAAACGPRGAEPAVSAAQHHYLERGIGCYMFALDANTIVDSSMKGNAARFVNHSCDPVCTTRVVTIEGSPVPARSAATRSISTLLWISDNGQCFAAHRLPNAD
jgi:hypothetical protein